jgi:hypothetical protein
LPRFRGRAGTGSKNAKSKDIVIAYNEHLFNKDLNAYKGEFLSDSNEYEIPAFVLKTVSAVYEVTVERDSRGPYMTSGMARIEPGKDYQKVVYEAKPKAEKNKAFRAARGTHSSSHEDADSEEDKAIARMIAYANDQNIREKLDADDANLPEHVLLHALKYFLRKLTYSILPLARLHKSDLFQYLRDENDLKDGKKYWASKEVNSSETWSTLRNVVLADNKRAFSTLVYIILFLQSIMEGQRKQSSATDGQGLMNEEALATMFGAALSPMPPNGDQEYELYMRTLMTGNNHKNKQAILHRFMVMEKSEIVPMYARLIRDKLPDDLLNELTNEFLSTDDFEYKAIEPALLRVDDSTVEQVLTSLKLPSVVAAAAAATDDDLTEGSTMQGYDSSEGEGEEDEETNMRYTLTDFGKNALREYEHEYEHAQNERVQLRKEASLSITPKDSKTTYTSYYGLLSERQQRNDQALQQRLNKSSNTETMPQQPLLIGYKGPITIEEKVEAILQKQRTANNMSNPSSLRPAPRRSLTELVGSVDGRSFTIQENKTGSKK